MFIDINKRKAYIVKQIHCLEKKIEKLPKGELLCVRNGIYTKWFQSNGSNPVYIQKKEQPFAELLALKKYYSLKINEFHEELKWLEQYPPAVKSSSLLENDSGCRELLQSHFKAHSNTVQEWLNEDYLHNTTYPEHLIHKSLAGHLVRSKSEIIIANALFTNHVPYRYECAYQIDDISLFPDFTILHPKNMKLFYWEHFGMMGDGHYRDKTYQKLTLYGNQGVIPTINLITTYETLEHPISSENVQRIIEEYFL